MTKTQRQEKRKEIANQRNEVAEAVQANAEAVQTADDLNYQEFLLDLEEATEAKEEAIKHRKAYEELMAKKSGKFVLKTQIFTTDAKSPAGYHTLELSYADLNRRENGNLKSALAKIVSHVERDATVIFNKLTDKSGSNPNRANLHRYEKELAEAQQKAIAEA